MKTSANQLLPGHQLKLLQGASELFASIVHDIQQAQSEVWLETYIFDFVGIGAEVAQALIHAALRGLNVRLLVDGVGTGELPLEWKRRFAVAGVQVLVFSPLGGLGLLNPSRWRRLHRKLCVVDGHTAYCGGINVLDDLHDPQYGSLEAPRFDFAVRVRGPLVAQVASVMRQQWSRMVALRQMRQRDLGGAWETVRRAAQAPVPEPERPSGTERRALGKAALLLRDNLRHRRSIERAYLKAIGSARQEIILANAYFLPGRRLRRALIHAVLRGVRVRILLQGRYEYFMQYHAAKPVYASLLAAGIEIWEYSPSFLHAKVAVIDGKSDQPWVTIGSSNLDPLSLLLAREANVVAVQPRLAQELRARLEAAMVHQGKRLDRKAYAERSVLARMLGWIAYGLMRTALTLTGKRY